MYIIKPTKILVLLTLTIICFSVFVACVPKLTTEIKASPAVHKLTLDRNCAAPCWAGIEVGITRFYEAKSILEKRYGVEHLKTTGTKYLAWSGGNSSVDNVREGGISFLDDIVDEITLALNDESGLAVQDLVETLGKPTWVQVSLGGPTDAPCLGISLQYPNRGMFAILDNEHELKGIEPNQSVSLLRFIPLPDGNMWTIYDGKALEWAGYQDYCQAAKMHSDRP